MLRHAQHWMRCRFPGRPLHDVCLFGPYGAGNIGDDAILQSLIARHFNPQEQRLAIVTEATQATARHIRSAHLVCRRDKDVMATAVQKSRGILLGGGTMISDCQGMGFPFHHSQAMLEMARQFGKPHAAMGIGVNPVMTPEGKAFFRTWYDRIEVFAVRDDYCANVLLDLGVSQERIVVAADPVFGWTPPQELAEPMPEILQTLSPERYKVAVNVTHEEWRDGKSLYTEIANCCDELICRLGATVVFFASDCRMQDPYDWAAIRATVGQMKESACLLPARNYAPAELATFLGRFDVVLSMRMHPLIMGALGGAVPIGIIRQRKMMRVLEEMGGGEASAKSVKAEPLFELCRTRLENAPAVRADMKRKLKHLAGRELNNRRAAEVVGACRGK